MLKIMTALGFMSGENITIIPGVLTDDGKGNKSFGSTVITDRGFEHLPMNINSVDNREGLAKVREDLLTRINNAFDQVDKQMKENESAPAESGGFSSEGAPDGNDAGKDSPGS